MSMRFEKVDLDKNFYFISFEQIEIGKTCFLKVNVLDKSSNTIIVIYQKYNDDLYDILADLQDFQNIDDKIYVIYKNGKLKFAFRK